MTLRRDISTSTHVHAPLVLKLEGLVDLTAPSCPLQQPCLVRRFFLPRAVQPSMQQLCDGGFCFFFFFLPPCPLFTSLSLSLSLSMSLSLSPSLAPHSSSKHTIVWPWRGYLSRRYHPGCVLFSRRHDSRENSNLASQRRAMVLPWGGCWLHYSTVP